MAWAVNSSRKHQAARAPAARIPAAAASCHRRKIPFPLMMVFPLGCAAGRGSIQAKKHPASKRRRVFCLMWMPAAVRPGQPRGTTITGVSPSGVVPVLVPGVCAAVIALFTAFTTP